MAEDEEEKGNPDDAGEGDKEEKKDDTPSPPTAIEQAEKLHQQIKAENDRREQLLEREEKLHAEKMLGGSSDAGQAPEKKKPLTDEEYKDKVMAGEVPEKEDAAAS